MKLSHHAFDYEYDFYRPCQHGSTCCQNNYCRCAQITNVHTKSIPGEYLIKELKKAIDKKRKWTAIEDYCIERLFVSNNLRNTNKYEFEVSRGYYGEEITGVTSDSLNTCEKEI